MKILSQLERRLTAGGKINLNKIKDDLKQGAKNIIDDPKIIVRKGDRAVKQGKNFVQHTAEIATNKTSEITGKIHKK